MVFDSFFIVVMCFCSIFTVLLLMFFFIGLLRFLTGSCHGEIRVSSHAELTEEERTPSCRVEPNITRQMGRHRGFTEEMAGGGCGEGSEII
eukprot:g18425.t1